MLLHVRQWSGASFHMRQPLCHIWNLTTITFTCRTMKLYVIFFLAVVNRGTSNNQPTEGMSCEMVRQSLYSGPLRSWMRLGPPCYGHCTNSYGLWEGKHPGTRLSGMAEVGFAGLVDASRLFSGYVLVVTAHKRRGKGHYVHFFLRGSWLKEIWPDFPKTVQEFCRWDRERT